MEHITYENWKHIIHEYRIISMKMKVYYPWKQRILSMETEYIIHGKKDYYPWNIWAYCPWKRSILSMKSNSILTMKTESILPIRWMHVIHENQIPTTFQWSVVEFCNIWFNELWTTCSMNVHWLVLRYFNNWINIFSLVSLIEYI